MGDDELFQRAFDAFALCYYGLTTVDQEAVSAASRKYAGALDALRKALCQQETQLQDQTLLSIMLLANCDEHLVDDDTRSRLLQGYTHIRGALALLALREKNGLSTSEQLELNGITRGRLLRQVIYVGEVPSSHLTEAIANRDASANEILNLYLAEIAVIRRDAHRLLANRRSPSSSIGRQRRKAAAELIRQSLALKKLSMWQETCSRASSYKRGQFSEEQFHVLESKGICFSRMFGDYSEGGIGAAVMLDRCRAARVICLPSAVRVITMSPEVVLQIAASSTQLNDWTARAQTALETAHQLINEILESIPAFFASSLSENHISMLNDPHEASLAKLGQLIWLLIVVSSVTCCLEAQRHFAKGVIGLMYILNGSRTLKQAA